MKFFVVFSAVVACAIARPGYFAPTTYLAAQPIFATPLAISSQYHAQDTLGQYTYGYADPLSAKSESRSIDGVTRGGYSYVDADGLVQNVQYTADSVNGFRVAASNLPVAPKAEEVVPLKPVEDTPEVAQAKTEHMAAIEEVKARDAAAPANADESESDSVEVAPAAEKSVAAPLVPAAVSYASPVSYYSYSGIAPAYTAYHQYVPAVHAYSYSPYSYSPFVYNSGHYVHELPADDAAVAQAKAEHAAAHVEAKARLAAAGGEV